MRRIEWVFVILFIASGLYCLGIVAGIVTFRLPLPHWFEVIGYHLSPFKWILIVVGIFISLWSIWKNRES